MQSNKCLRRLQGQLYRPLEAHQRSHDWPWGVTKRGIKTTITATTTRGYRDVYIQPSQYQHKVHRHLRILLVILILCYFLKTLYTDFGIGDVVAGTTLVTTLRELSYHFQGDINKGTVPSGCTHNDWRVCTSSAIIRALSVAAKVDKLVYYVRTAIPTWFHTPVTGNIVQGIIVHFKPLIECFMKCLVYTCKLIHQ